MDDKELLIDILIEKISNIPSKLFGVDLGVTSKKYIKILLTKQIEEKHELFNLFFSNSELIEPDLFFESVIEILNNSQIKIFGVSLDSHFITSIQHDFKIKKGV